MVPRIYAFCFYVFHVQWCYAGVVVASTAVEPGYGVPVPTSPVTVIEPQPEPLPMGPPIPVGPPLPVGPPMPVAPAPSLLVPPPAQPSTYVASVPRVVTVAEPPPEPVPVGPSVPVAPAPVSVAPVPVPAPAPPPTYVAPAPAPPPVVEVPPYSAPFPPPTPLPPPAYVAPPSPPPPLPPSSPVVITKSIRHRQPHTEVRNVARHYVKENGHTSVTAMVLSSKEDMEEMPIELSLPLPLPPTYVAPPLALTYIVPPSPSLAPAPVPVPASAPIPAPVSAAVPTPVAAMAPVPAILTAPELRNFAGSYHKANVVASSSSHGHGHRHVHPFGYFGGPDFLNFGIDDLRIPVLKARARKRKIIAKKVAQKHRKAEKKAV